MHPVQEAFVAGFALQCGFCTPGFVMASHALLERNPNPTEEEIRHDLSSNLCMCTGYVQIVEAVKRGGVAAASNDRATARTSGERARSKEAPRHVTGAGATSTTWSLPRMLHACILRSPYAHARIVSVTGPVTPAAMSRRSRSHHPRRRQAAVASVQARTLRRRAARPDSGVRGGRRQGALRRRAGRHRRRRHARHGRGRARADRGRVRAAAGSRQPLRRRSRRPRRSSTRSWAATSPGRGTCRTATSTRRFSGPTGSSGRT